VLFSHTEKYLFCTLTGNKKNSSQKISYGIKVIR